MFLGISKVGLSFTVRCYASLVRYMLWPGVCLSVTSQSSTETASEIPPGSPPAGAPNAVGVG